MQDRSKISFHRGIHRRIHLVAVPRSLCGARGTLSIARFTMKINIGKPDRTRANIIQVSPSPGTLCYSLLFLHRPVIKRQMKKKLAHSPRAQATIIRRASTLPCYTSPLPSLPPSSSPHSFLAFPHENTHARQLIKRCLRVRRKERNKRE